MSPVEIIRDALDKGGKVKGFRQPVYRDDGSLKSYARQMIELVAGDVLEVATLALSKAPGDEIAKALEKGSRSGAKDRRSSFWADDIFHICDLAGTAKPAPKKD